MTSLIHRKLFYFGKSKKLTKNVIFYFRKLCVRIVIAYADKVLAQSTTTQTRKRLHGHFWKNFEGFLQILKEQSGEKGTWVTQQQ